MLSLLLKRPRPAVAFRRLAQRIRHTTAFLCLLWLAVTWLTVWAARTWDVRFFGWSFGFWMAAQGVVWVYLGVVVVAAVAINRLERLSQSVPVDEESSTHGG